MIFSWAQVASFFAVLAVAGWLVYPSEYFRGQMYRDEGSRSRSITFYGDYLARHPFHKGATRSLAAAYEAAGKPEAAAALLEAFYRHRRGDAESGRDLLELLDRAGMSERAFAFRRELFADLRNRPAADRRWLEELAYRNLQEAMVSQDDAKTIAALNILAGISSEGSGYRDEVLRRYLARKDFPAALAMIRQNIAKDPADVEWRRMLVRVHQLMQDAPGTLTALQDGLRRFPGDVPLLQERFDTLSKRGDCRAALPDLEKLMALQPKVEAWPQEIGSCLMRTGKIDDGMRFLEGLLQKHPNDPQKWWNLIYGYSDRGMYKESIAWLERFLERFPEDGAGVDMLVYEYEVLQEYGRAIDALTRYLARVPGDLKRARTRASLLVAERRYPETAQAYEALIARSPDDQTLWKALIYEHQSHHDFARTKDATERFLRRFPGEEKAYDTLTTIHLERGDKAQAIATLEEYFKGLGVPVPAPRGTPMPPGETR